MKHYRIQGRLGVVMVPAHPVAVILVISVVLDLVVAVVVPRKNSKGSLKL